MLGTGKHTLVSLTVDMVKKYESEKYRIRPSERMRGDARTLSRRTQARRRGHRGTARGRETGATLSFSRVSDLPDDLPDWIRAEESAKRHAAAVREAAAPMFDSCL